MKEVLEQNDQTSIFDEIKGLQAQAASTKEQKRTREQIDIYSSGTNILVSASAGSGKDLCHGAADAGSTNPVAFD